MQKYEKLKLKKRILRNYILSILKDLIAIYNLKIYYYK